MHKRFALAICLGVLGAATVGAAPASAGKAPPWAMDCYPDAGGFTISYAGKPPGGTASVLFEWFDAGGGLVASVSNGKPLVSVINTDTATLAPGRLISDITNAKLTAIASNGSIKASISDPNCLALG